jgi:hypothetical protein
MTDKNDLSTKTANIVTNSGLVLLLVANIILSSINSKFKYGDFSKLYLEQKHQLDSTYNAKADSLDKAHKIELESLDKKFNEIYGNFKEYTGDKK